MHQNLKEKFKEDKNPDMPLDANSIPYLKVKPKIWNERIKRVIKKAGNS